MNLIQFLASKLEKTYLKEGQYLYKINSVNTKTGVLRGICIDTCLDPDTGPINLMWSAYLMDDFFDLSKVEILSQEEFEKEINKTLSDLKNIII